MKSLLHASGSIIYDELYYIRLVLMAQVQILAGELHRGRLGSPISFC